MIKPCDECKNRQNCTNLRIVRREARHGPWKLDDALRGRFVHLSVTSADGDNITLDCSDFKSEKKSVFYTERPE